MAFFVNCSTDETKGPRHDGIVVRIAVYQINVALIAYLTRRGGGGGGSVCLDNFFDLDRNHNNLFKIESKRFKSGLGSHKGTNIHSGP